MGLCDSGMVGSDQFVLCKAALILGVTRWIFSWARKLVQHYMCIFSWSLDLYGQEQPVSSPACSSSLVALVKEHLSLTAFEEIAARRPESGRDMSCTVCLNRFKMQDQVWELSNCSHVFHEDCLNKWLAYDARLSCPLCRTSLINLSSHPSSPSSSLSVVAPPQQASWAVERIQYLFGDDLLCSSSYPSSGVDCTYSTSCLPCSIS